MRFRLGFLMTVCGLALGAAFGAHGQTARKAGPARLHAPATVEERWRESLDAFSASDRDKAPHAGGVLFVGSSSIRLWADLESQFGAVPVVKRGFGGSRMSDCARYADRLVVAYQPRTVIVYAGDNDLAEGRTPQQVLESFQTFVERVHDELPDTRIAYLSIKPSPLRSALMPLATETNALIRAYSTTTPNLDFIDVYSKMLDARGQPRADLYLADALHLSPAGYAVWKSAIASHLAPAVSSGASPGL